MDIERLIKIIIECAYKSNVSIDYINNNMFFCSYYLKK